MSMSCSFSLEAEALYRAQLERYAASMARSPLMPSHYSALLSSYAPELLRQASAASAALSSSGSGGATSTTTSALSYPLASATSGSLESTSCGSKSASDRDRKRRRSSRDHKSGSAASSDLSAASNGSATPFSLIPPIGNVDNTALLRPPVSLTTTLGEIR